jgi:hypothetical protein
MDKKRAVNELLLMAKALVGGRDEDILMDILKDSNLEEIAKDLTKQIMKPIEMYYRTGDEKYLFKGKGKYRPKKDFSLKKCMGDYEIEVIYIASNKGLYLNDASETFMSFKVLRIGSQEYGYVEKSIDKMVKRLGNEVADLIEHEMGHYYLGIAGDVGECIYNIDPRGVQLYFQDPQEMVLHSKVLFNKFKRQYPDFASYEMDKIERIISRYVRDLPIDTNAPRSAKFPKGLQKKYVNHILKHYVKPVLR